MKKPSTILFCMGVYFVSFSQSAAPPPCTGTSCHQEITVVKNPESATLKGESWRGTNVTERKEFYQNKTTFDPAFEYDSLYDKSATSGQCMKTEKGVAKLTGDNTKAQIAYYNNAGAGTILKLTNPDNGKTAYVVAVGKIPPAESSSYLIVVSDRAATKLGLKNYSSLQVTYFGGTTCLANIR